MSPATCMELKSSTLTVSVFPRPRPLRRTLPRPRPLPATTSTQSVSPVYIARHDNPAHRQSLIFLDHDLFNELSHDPSLDINTVSVSSRLQGLRPDDDRKVGVHSKQWTLRHFLVS